MTEFASIESNGVPDTPLKGQYNKARYIFLLNEHTGLRTRRKDSKGFAGLLIAIKLPLGPMNTHPSKILEEVSLIFTVPPVSERQFKRGRQWGKRERNLLNEPTSVPNIPLLESTVRRAILTSHKDHSRSLPADPSAPLMSIYEL